MFLVKDFYTVLCVQLKDFDEQELAEETFKIIVP